MNVMAWLGWLLVPLAGWMGWRLARQTLRSGVRRRAQKFNDQYFQGLNYLLNEQPDKAIEVFLELAEVNRDTVETHLALGSLFRRRGEVARAIRIHQNIIAKRSLSEDQRTQALLELGEDYMRAGLLDRAEKLFSEMVERDSLAPTALEHLIDIYQQEKDWERALEMARRLEQVTDRRMGRVMAQFCCELAEAALAEGDDESVRRHLRLARRHDPESLRARFIGARLAAREDDPDAALAAWEEAVALAPDHVPMVLDDYRAFAAEHGAAERARQHLADWAGEHDGASLVLARAEDIERAEGADAAARFLVEALHARPTVRGLDRLVDLKLSGATAAGASDEILQAVIQRLLEREPRFRCGNCGFSGQTHHWLCPSCRQWGTTRPIRGVLAE